MKGVSMRLFFLLLIVACFGVAGCNDPNAIIDQNTLIENNNWSYVNKIKHTVNITDDTVPYNLYLNVRVTADYKYANLFLIIKQTGPDKKPKSARYEIKLANSDGEWLGSGSGNIYSYQVPFAKKYKFPAKGVYTFEMEQNMRDNPLHEVSDVGLRVEKADKN